MDIFRLHQDIIADYAGFTRSFSPIRDGRIRHEVDAALGRGALWPAPWIQLNPTFELAGSTDDLIGRGLLHATCARIFRVKRHPGDGGKTFTFYRHQVEAIEAARRGESYILTTGTGSGKSIAYIVPIVDRVLREGPGKGIRAIVVYPMNALANSQFGELEKFLQYGFESGKAPLTFARYTGQEDEEDRERIIANPPDILLTNYVMLELILTRSRERRQLIAAARGKLRFLVLDELHTYRGRQGSDVAMLVRRVREACDVRDLQCVGTSATLAGGGSEAEAKAEVARTATRLFGAAVPVENVIGETLTRATGEMDFAAAATRERLAARVRGAAPLPGTAEGFIHDPLAAWIESTFGLTTSAESGRLI